LADRIPIFPQHCLLLPHVDLGIHAFEERYRSLVAHSLSNGHTFGVVLIKQGREVGGPAQPHRIGTLAHISGYARLPDGRYLLEVEGSRRFRIESHKENGPYPTARVTWLTESIGNFAGARALSNEVAQLFHLYRSRCGDAVLPVLLPVDPVSRSYLVASEMRIDVPEKQGLLEADTAEDRLRAERDILRREIALLEHLRSSRG
jgi:Lon protease-like protein